MCSVGGDGVCVGLYVRAILGRVEGLIIVSQLCRMFEKLGQSFSIDCKTHSIHRDHGLDVLNISLISEIISLFLN